MSENPSMRSRLIGLTALTLALALVVVGLVSGSGAAAQSDPASPAQDISVTYSFFGTDTFTYLVPGAKAFVRIEASNTGGSPTVLGLEGVFPSRHIMAKPYYPRALAGYRVAGLGWNHDGPDTVQFRLKLNPGETHRINIPFNPGTDLVPDEELVSRIGYCVMTDGETCPDANPGSSDPPPSFQWLDPVRGVVRYRDLGDAPDSTNHPASPMPAYPSVQANFPTVFDPATGADQGPAHRDPRLFHLGRRVSPEAEADVGPDLDPTNNIRPGANRPNRDRRDDGIRLYNLAFDHCATTTIPVQVLIRPLAIAFFEEQGSPGYLNVWLDGNRDGDWADAGPCGDPPQPGIEHIVIDYPVDVVTLGPGLHTINVPTGLVPWPAAQEQKATWLRLTLSDHPSNKGFNAGGVDYGDGRGYASPFELGETEDYLYFPPQSSSGGVDIQVEASAKLQPVSSSQGDQLSKSATAENASFNFTKVQVSVRAKNIGSKKASNYRLRVPLPWVDTDSIRFNPNPAPGVQGRLEGNTVIFDTDSKFLDDLVIVLAGTNWCLTCTRALDAPVQDTVSVQAFVESDEDVNPNNDQAQVDLKLGLPAPTVGWMDAATPDLLKSGMTCQSNVELRGRYLPGTTMHIFADGFESGNVSVAANGSWSYPLNLTNGLHRVRVAAERASQTSPRSDAMFIGVNTNLPWSPNSFIFTNSRGQALRAFDSNGNGASVANDWSVRLKPGETYSVSAHYCGPDPSAELAFELGDLVVPMWDLNHDSTYEGSFTLPTNSTNATTAETSARLVITSDSVAETFDGTVLGEAEGTVRDVVNGSPLAGATVSLLEAVDASEDSDTAFGLWPGGDYGQPNPQTTAADGEFSFSTPPGTYRLEVDKAGYQSYRGWEVSIVDEWMRQDIPLAPVVQPGSSYVIQISPDGFSPSVLRVRPGSVIKWVNVDMDGHSTTSTSGDWDSGWLGGDDSFTLQFNTEGAFAYADQANPFNTGDIVVDVNAPAPYNFFVPVVYKNN